MLCLCHYSFPLSSPLPLSRGLLSHPLLFIMHTHSQLSLPLSPLHTHSSLLLSPTDAPYLPAPARWCFGDDIHYKSPHDLWHCLVGQLLFPSLINFDVEPNEIRQLIKAAADSGLIYSCAWHKWHKLMRRSLYVSSGLREVQNCSSAVHQLPPEMASASTHSTEQHSGLAAEQEPPSSSVCDFPSLLLSAKSFSYQLLSPCSRL